jgi:hypothetical protein
MPKFQELSSAKKECLENLFRFASAGNEVGFKKLFLSSIANEAITPEDVNQGDSFGRTMLMKACARPDNSQLSKWEIITFLINNGANQYQRDDEGNTPLGIIKTHHPKSLDKFGLIISMRNAAIFLLNEDDAFTKIPTPNYENIDINEGAEIAALILSGSNTQAKEKILKTVESVLDSSLQIGEIQNDELTAMARRATAKAVVDSYSKKMGGNSRNGS